MVKKNTEDKFSQKKDNAWHGQEKKIIDFSKDYMNFLDNSKTERLATKEIIQRLEKAGFKDITKYVKIKPGDKIYLNQKDKSVIAAVIGKDTTKFNLVGSHIDSPRLDLKPNPLVESNSLALLKTHYYGGIKKYQWTNVDLVLTGVIFTKDGKKIDLNYGGLDEEPVFIISDLLPHLARKQLEKNGREIVEGEQLNIFIGSIPVEDKEAKEKVKSNILSILNKKYGIVEEDFSFAELNFVPAQKSREIGFDRSLIAGYGQDDKACSYASLRSLLDLKLPNVTAVSYFSDKEEIGSVGNTGAESFILWDFSEKIISKANLKTTAKEMLSNSRAISADVSAAVNPSFSDVHDEKNAATVGYGVVLEKYTGGGGKYEANDCSAEYMNEIRQLLIKNNIKYQTAEIGKVDAGGGGTLAMYLSRFGIDTVDAGPGVLGMHSPREVLSKADLYESYRLYKAFFI